MPNQYICPTCYAPFHRRGTKLARYCSIRCRSAIPLATISDDGLTALVPLHARRGTIIAHAVIDATYADWANQWRWSLTGTGYAINQHDRMHRALMGRTHGDGTDVDHINRDKLDNRRANLRVMPSGRQPQNQGSRPGSSSRYRGVTWDRNAQKWQAKVTVNYRTVYLGIFSDEDEAGEAARLGRARLLPYAVD